ncbi:hypothetical protein HK102_002464 [Quaeritorhiza haematococci]|nr:hypothetical protein HK102_002464 [Quaeritorhiza haematococci]
MATHLKYLSQKRVVFPVGLKYDEKKSREKGYPCKILDPPPPQGWQQLTMDSVGRSFRLNSLGLVLGPVSGVLAVDIDNMDLWKVVLDTLGETEPLTCRSISQRGAVHLLFKVTPALEAVRRKGVFNMKPLGYNDVDILGQVAIEVLTRGLAAYHRVRGSYIKQAMAEKPVVAEKKEEDKGVVLEHDGSSRFTAAEETPITLDTEDCLKEVEKHVKKLCAEQAIDRQSWIKVGMAIHHATDGQGMELWDTFSRQAGPYNRRDLEYQWDLFKNGSGITIGSLIHWAKEDSKEAWEEKKRLKAEDDRLRLKHIDGVITKLETASYKNGLIDDLGTLVGMRSKNFVQDLDKKKRWLLAFNNGVGTQQHAFDSTGYDYDPGCTKHQDRILDFLCKVFPDPDVREYTLRYLASCLAGYTRNQLAFFGYGRGANGKSKLLSLMKETLGDYTFAMKHEMITGKTNSDPNAATPMLMALVGKRFVYVSENVDGRAINECTFKTFSGGDTTSGRGLYGAPATMQMDFKLFFVCNHLPKFNARDDAMVRRIKVIPFVSTFVAPHVPERPKDHVYRGDPTLDDEVFATWRAGFMNMLLDCYRQYKEHDLGPTPAAVDLATTDYKTDNDAYQLFLDERTVPVAKDDKDAWIQPSVLWPLQVLVP